VIQNFLINDIHLILIILKNVVTPREVPIVDDNQRVNKWILLRLLNTDFAILVTNVSITKGNIL